MNYDDYMSRCMADIKRIFETPRAETPAEETPEQLPLPLDEPKNP